MSSINPEFTDLTSGAEIGSAVTELVGFRHKPLVKAVANFLAKSHGNVDEANLRLIAAAAPLLNPNHVTTLVERLPITELELALAPMDIPRLRRAFFEVLRLTDQDVRPKLMEDLIHTRTFELVDYHLDNGGTLPGEGMAAYEVLVARKLGTLRNEPLIDFIEFRTSRIPDHLIERSIKQCNAEWRVEYTNRFLAPVEEDELIDTPSQPPSFRVYESDIDESQYQREAWEDRGPFLNKRWSSAMTPTDLSIAITEAGDRDLALLLDRSKTVTTDQFELLWQRITTHPYEEGRLRPNFLKSDLEDNFERLAAAVLSREHVPSQLLTDALRSGQKYLIDGALSNPAVTREWMDLALEPGEVTDVIWFAPSVGTDAELRAMMDGSERDQLVEELASRPSVTPDVIRQLSDHGVHDFDRHETATRIRTAVARNPDSSSELLGVVTEATSNMVNRHGRKLLKEYSQRSEVDLLLDVATHPNVDPSTLASVADLVGHNDLREYGPIEDLIDVLVRNGAIDFTKDFEDMDVHVRVRRAAAIGSGAPSGMEMPTIGALRSTLLSTGLREAHPEKSWPEIRRAKTWDELPSMDTEPFPENAALQKIATTAVDSLNAIVPKNGLELKMLGNRLGNCLGDYVMEAVEGSMVFATYPDRARNNEYAVSWNVVGPSIEVDQVNARGNREDDVPGTFSNGIDALTLQINGKSRAVTNPRFILG